MDTSTQFLYSLDNLSLFSASILSSIVAIIIGVILIIIWKFLFSYISWSFLLLKDRRVIEEKKQVLGELILMKEIQTELEKEIEQAALKATFQNG